MLVAVLGDIHVPYHDEKALKIALKIIKRYKPDQIKLIGDIVDFYSISKYMKDPGRITQLQDDIDKTKEILERIRDSSPKSKVEYLEGNHENRFDRVLKTKAPELWCLRDLSVERQLDLKKLGIKYNTSHTDIGDFTYTHGTIVRKHSGYTARAHAEDHGSLIHGHTHRLGSYFRSDGRGYVQAHENGCLCDLKPEFINGRADWHHGFSMVTHDKLTHVEQVRIINGEAVYRGELWSK